MIGRLLQSNQTYNPINSIFVKICRRALPGLLALFTFSTLYGCSILRVGDDPAVDPPTVSTEPRVTPGDSVVDLPDTTSEDSVVVSTESPARPIVDARCDFNSELDSTINTLVNELTRQKIPYTLGSESIGEWRDCSGIFLRFSSALAESCPMLESQLAASAGVRKYSPGADNVVKDVEARGERSTRTIASWYHSQGGFTPVVYASPRDEKMAVTDMDVTQLVDIRDRIKVGSVLWFSRHKPQSGDDIQTLFNKHINHMGVVTEVIRDENGILEQYKMFHGHGKKNNGAKTTKDHYWDWDPGFNNHERYPPLGYWTQYVVGIAPIFAGHIDDITLSAY
ncbi:MAG: hypothetical protein AB8B97_24895 [Granulosicoccus sp.]